MTTAVNMERVAKLLGSEYSYITTQQKGKNVGRKLRHPYMQRKDCDGGGWYSTHTLSDGDLLLAILNKAAEMGHVPALEVAKPDLSEVRIWPRKGRTSWTNFYHAFGTTPLEAAIAAFVQLPEKP